MGTQTQPEQEDTTQNTQEQPEQEQVQEQPLPPQAAPSDNREVLNAYQQELQRQANENRLLKERLDSMERERTNTPTSTPEEESQQFFANPKQVVRDEIRSATAPLNEFVAQQRRRDLVDSFKVQLRNSPQFQHFSKIESLFDQYIGQVSIIDVNSIVGSYNAALGLFISQNGPQALIDTSTQNNQPNNTNTNRTLVTQPRVPPAPPRAPNQNTTTDKPWLKMDENQKKMARFNNMTDEDWWNETYNTTPSEVATKKVGK